MMTQVAMRSQQLPKRKQPQLIEIFRMQDVARTYRSLSEERAQQLVIQPRSCSFPMNGAIDAYQLKNEFEQYRAQLDDVRVVEWLYRQLRNSGKGVFTSNVYILQYFFIRLYHLSRRKAPSEREIVYLAQYRALAGFVQYINGKQVNQLRANGIAKLGACQRYNVNQDTLHELMHHEFYKLMHLIQLYLYYSQHDRNRVHMLVTREIEGYIVRKQLVMSNAVEFYENIQHVYMLIDAGVKNRQYLAKVRYLDQYKQVLYLNSYTVQIFVAEELFKIFYASTSNVAAQSGTKAIEFIESADNLQYVTYQAICLYIFEIISYEQYMIDSKHVQTDIVKQIAHCYRMSIQNCKQYISDRVDEMELPEGRAIINFVSLIETQREDLHRKYVKNINNIVECCNDGIYGIDDAVLDITVHGDEIVISAIRLYQYKNYANYYLTKNLTCQDIVQGIPGVVEKIARVYKLFSYVAVKPEFIIMLPFRGEKVFIRPSAHNRIPGLNEIPDLRICVASLLQFSEDMYRLDGDSVYNATGSGGVAGGSPVIFENIIDRGASYYYPSTSPRREQSVMLMCDSQSGLFYVHAVPLYFLEYVDILDMRMSNTPSLARAARQYLNNIIIKIQNKNYGINQFLNANMSCIPQESILTYIADVVRILQHTLPRYSLEIKSAIVLDYYSVQEMYQYAVVVTLLQNVVFQYQEFMRQRADFCYQFLQVMNVLSLLKGAMVTPGDPLGLIAFYVMAFVRHIEPLRILAGFG